MIDRELNSGLREQSSLLPLMISNKHGCYWSYNNCIRERKESSNHL